MVDMSERGKSMSVTSPRDIQTRDAWRILAVAVGVAATPASAWATSVFDAPTGLAAGSSYRLMFITADTTDGMSSDIGTYNSFASTEAALNALLPSTTWSAIVSTPTTNAIDNTDGGSTSSAAYTSDPIFMVDGTEVVASLENFFAASDYLTNSNFENSLMINPLSEDQNGSQAQGGYIWSGSNQDGSTATGNEMGSADPQTWRFYGDGSPYDAFPFSNTAELPLIAISAPITVGTPVPEPGSAPLFAAGAAMLAAVGIRRRSRTRG
jgi:hypothetical protein